MGIKSFILGLLILFIFSSCSGTYHAYWATLKIALSKEKQVEMTLAEVKQSAVDLISVKRGQRAKVVMALAYLEDAKHKWVSNDKIMLTMDKGRLVKTTGLKIDLLHRTNLSNDPLKVLPKEQNNLQTWSHEIDLTNDQYGYPIESTFTPPVPSKIKVFGIEVEATLHIETLRYNALADYLRLNNTWENYFWYSKDGVLIKSKQKVSPLSEPLEIVYLSRIIRLK